MFPLIFLNIKILSTSEDLDIVTQSSLLAYEVASLGLWCMGSSFARKNGWSFSTTSTIRSCLSQLSMHSKCSLSSTYTDLIVAIEWSTVHIARKKLNNSFSWKTQPETMAHGSIVVLTSSVSKPGSRLDLAFHLEWAPNNALHPRPSPWSPIKRINFWPDNDHDNNLKANFPI